MTSDTRSPATKAAEREAFEAWARNQNLDTAPHCFWRGEYKSLETQTAWLSWEARALATTIPAAPDGWVTIRDRSARAKTGRLPTSLSKRRGPINSLVADYMREHPNEERRKVASPAPQRGGGLSEAELIDIIEANTGVAYQGAMRVVGADIAARAIISRLTTEDTPHDGWLDIASAGKDGPRLTPEQANARLVELRGSQDWTRRYFDGDKSAIAEYDRLIAAVSARTTEDTPHD